MCKSSNIQLVNGLEGSDVMFSFTRPLKTDEILFTFEGNKVLEWEVDSNISYFGKFSERANLIENTIMIKNLLLNDSGIYKLSFTSTAGTVSEEIYQLIVYVPLSKPTISCVANDSIIHLNCFVTEPATMEWKHENSTVQQGGHFNLTLEGTSLAILNPKESSGEYTCIVRQPGEVVRSDPFNIKGCFKNEEGRNHILLAIAIILIILVIVAVLCWCLFKRDAKNEYKQPCGKRESSQDVEAKPESAEGEEERKPVLAGNGEETKPQPSGDLDQRKPSSNDAEGDLALHNLE